MTTSHHVSLVSFHKMSTSKKEKTRPRAIQQLRMFYPTLPMFVSLTEHERSLVKLYI